MCCCTLPIHPKSGHIKCELLSRNRVTHIHTKKRERERERVPTILHTTVCESKNTSNLWRCAGTMCAKKAQKTKGNIDFCVCVFYKNHMRAAACVCSLCGGNHEHKMETRFGVCVWLYVAHPPKKAGIFLMRTPLAKPCDTHTHTHTKKREYPPFHQKNTRTTVFPIYIYLFFHQIHVAPRCPTHIHMWSRVDRTHDDGCAACVFLT